MYALLRWDVSPVDGTAVLKPRIDSQDSWVFQTPVRIAADGEMGFEIGRLRSDNRIAAIFLDTVQYRVVNNPLDIKTFHLQNETDRPGRTRGGALLFTKRRVPETIFSNLIHCVLPSYNVFVWCLQYMLVDVR